MKTTIFAMACCVITTQVSHAQTASELAKQKVEWPALIWGYWNVPNRPLLFTQPPIYAPPEEDALLKSARSSDLPGILVYRFEGKRGALVLRHFVPSAHHLSKRPEVVSVIPSLEPPYPFGRFAFDLSGQNLWFDSADTSQLDIFRPYQWNLISGKVTQTPLVPEATQYNREWNGDPQRPYNIGHLWSGQRQRLAYWFATNKRRLGRGSLDTQLALTSTNKMRALAVHPNPRLTTLAWTSAQTLLYAYAPLLEPKPPLPLLRQLFEPRVQSPGWWVSSNYPYNYWPDGSYADDRSPQPWRNAHEWPSIYEANPQTARGQRIIAKRLIANAFAPIPSPDNRFIAFIGWGYEALFSSDKIPPQAPDAATEPRWWLWDRQTQKRTLLGPKPVFARDAMWSQDSQTLFFNAVPGARRSITSGDAVPKPETALIFSVNIGVLLDGSRPNEASPIRAIGQITISAAASARDHAPDFQIRGLTHDRQYLLIDSRESELIKRGDDLTFGDQYDHFNTIHALRLSDGHHQVVARLKNAESYDWFDLTSTPK